MNTKRPKSLQLLSSKERERLGKLYWKVIRVIESKTGPGDWNAGQAQGPSKKVTCGQSLKENEEVARLFP